MPREAPANVDTVGRVAQRESTPFTGLTSDYKDSCGFRDPLIYKFGLDSGLNLDSAQGSKARRRLLSPDESAIDWDHQIGR
jgi:hypothetical protein